MGWHLEGDERGDRRRAGLTENVLEGFTSDSSVEHA